LKTGAEADLQIAMKLLGMQSQHIHEDADWDVLKRQAMRRWHPDKALALNFGEDRVLEYTINFQKIPWAIHTVKSRIKPPVQYTSPVNHPPRKKQVRPPNPMSSFPHPPPPTLLRVEVRQYSFQYVDDPGYLLYLAIKRDRLDLVKKLLDGGVSSNALVRRRSVLIWAVIYKNEDALELLLNAGADMNFVVGNKAALFWAVELEALGLVEQLIAAGAEATLRTNSGWTLLMTAAHKMEIGIAHCLINQGVDVNAQNSDGWTALLQAVENECMEMVEFLLAVGADLHHKCRDGNHALKIATRKKNKPLIQLLRQ